MDARAAKGIAACVRRIAENSARIAIIDLDSGHMTQAATVDRVHCVMEIEKAEKAIAQWFQQPMTWR